MTIELSLRALSPSVLADGPTRFALELTNAGPGEVTVPVAGGSSPFEYAIHAGDGSRLIASASEEAMRDAHPWMKEMPLMRLGDLELSPGASARYEEDLVSLLTAPLPPGDYLVQASYRPTEGETTVSTRVPIRVLVSRPTAIAHDLSVREGRVITAEWHAEPDAKALLRERRSGELPLGRFFDLGAVEARGPIRQVAVSRDTAPGIPEGWRWLAWLDGADLFAGVAQESRLLFPTRPIALDLESPSLLPFGYTLLDRGALFVVTGARARRPVVRLIRVPKGPAAAPVSMDVTLDDPPDTAPVAATCVWGLDAAPELILSWVQEIKGATLIIAGRVSATTGEPASPPKGIFVTLRPVLTTHFPPSIGPGERPHAQVLLGPDLPGHDHLTHVTFEAGNPSVQTSREIANLPPSAGEVARWVLPSDPTSGAPLLAVAGGDLWVSGSQGWARLAPHPPGQVEPWSVRLWVFSTKMWLATWFDREGGYRARWLDAV